MTSGFFGRFQRRDGRRQFVAIRPWPPLCPHTLLEEAFRVVVGFSLHILTQRKRHRSAFSRIGQHRHGPRQRRNDLFRPGDPVEIARDRAKTIIGRNCAIVE